MCLISQKVARTIFITIAVLTFLNAIGLFAVALAVLFNPFMTYARSSLTIAFFAFVAFLILLASGVLTCVGLTCRKPVLLKALFVCLLIASLWLFALSAAMVHLNSVYQPKATLSTCAERYEVVPDIVYLGSTVMQDKLCSAACTCDYNLDNTISTALGSGIDLANGQARLQDCGSSVWKSEYDLAGSMMASLETLYNCRGFCENPTQEHFSFTQVNNQSIATLCHGFFDKYVQSVTMGYSGQFFGAAALCVFELLLLLILGISSLSHKITLQNQGAFEQEGPLQAWRNSKIVTHFPKPPTGPSTFKKKIADL